MLDAAGSGFAAGVIGAIYSLVNLWKILKLSLDTFGSPKDSAEGTFGRWFSFWNLGSVSS